MAWKIDKLREGVLVIFLVVGIPLVGIQIWQSVGEPSVISQAAQLDSTAEPDTTAVILERPDSFTDF